MITDTYWPRLYQRTEPHQVGGMKISGKVQTPSEMAKIVKALKGFREDHNIILWMLLGGGIGYDSLPAYKHTRKVNNLRLTTPELRDEMLPVARSNLETVVTALNQGGVPAKAMPMDMLVARPHGYETDENGTLVDMQFTGNVEKVNTAYMREAIYNGITPVISHMCPDRNGVFYNVNAMPAATDVVKANSAYKLIAVGKLPLLDKEDNIISEIRTGRQLQQLIDDGTLSEGALLNAQEADKLLMIMGPGRSVQFATPDTLESELMSDGGGTIIREPYNIEAIFKPEHYSKVDSTEKLTQLFNEGLSMRGLKLVNNYWNGNELNHAHPISMIYYESEGTGGAVVRELNGTHLLCKVVTHPDYQGSGLARQMLERIAEDYDSGYMGRTKIDERNQSIGFYERFIDRFKNSGLHDPNKFTGYEKIGNYFVFAVNVTNEQWNAHKGYVAKLPETVELVE